MPKFCTKCGRPLAEGEICTCQQPQAAQSAGQAMQSQPQQQAAQFSGQTMQSQPQQQAAQFSGQGMPQQAQAGQFSGQAMQSQPQPQAAQSAGQGMPQQPQAGQFSGQAVPPPQMQQFQGMPQGVPYTGVPYGMQQPKQPSGAGKFFKDFAGTFVNVIKSPMEGGKNFVASADYLVAGAYILVQAFLVALYGVIFEAGIASYINKMLGFWGGSISMPYVKVFFVTFALSVVFSAALAGILLAFSLMFGNKTNYQSMLCVTALRSIGIAPVSILAMLITLIQPVAGAVVFFAANIWGIVMTAVCMPASDEKSKRFLPLYVFLAYFIFFVIALVIMVKCAGVYFPSDFGDALGGLGSILG